jgi:hypothetical protein
MKKKIRMRIKEKKEVRGRKKINIKELPVKMVVMGKRRENSKRNINYIQLRMKRT